MTREFAKPPEDKEELIDGLKQTIENTKKKIVELRFEGADASTFEAHLNVLEFQLEMARKKDLQEAT